MIRNVDTVLKERLRVRAAQHGRSMEAELRHILRVALNEQADAAPNLAEAIRRRFAPLGGVELAYEAHEPLPPPPDFA